MQITAVVASEIKILLESKQTLIITDISDWTDATTLIHANENAVVWYTF